MEMRNVLDQLSREIQKITTISTFMQSINDCDIKLSDEDFAGILSCLKVLKEKTLQIQQLTGTSK